MTAIRTARAAEGRFVQISNVAARDERLTLEALGVITKVLSYPPDWTFSAEWLETVVPNGRRSVRSALRLLEECGYFRRTKRSGGRGRWEWDQVISDEPLPVEEPEEAPETGGRVTSGRSTSDDNRPHETTCEDTTSSQVSSSDRLSSDDNRSDTPNTGDLTRSQHGGSETPPESPPASEPGGAPAKPKRSRKRKERTPEQQAAHEAADKLAHWWWDQACPKRGIPVTSTNRFPGFRAFLEEFLAAADDPTEVRVALEDCGQSWPSRTALERAITDRRGRNPRRARPDRPSNQHHESAAADTLAEVF